MKRIGKKGLASGLVGLTLLLFFFAFANMVALTLWNETNDIIQGLDNETVSQDVKDKINSLTSRMLWADKLFVFFFIMLLIAYLISSVTIPVDQPIFLIIFIAVLILNTIIAMFLSNAWRFMFQFSQFGYAAAQLSFTDFFMTYLPIITFFIGIAGAALFYSRRSDSNIGGGSVPDGFE